MNILHLINDFNHTKVHRNFVYELDCLGYCQSVFIPLKNENHKGKNEFEFKVINSKFVYSNLLRKYHIFFFRNKIEKLYLALKASIDLKLINIVHASTLFSDGALAYKVHQKWNIPYIVTVRNTDIFTFYKYRKDLIFLGRDILKNASRVIFISDANLNSFTSLSFLNGVVSYSKIKVIHNGIDQFWIINRRSYSFSKKRHYNALYVGRFDNNKNVLQLIRCIQKFNIANSHCTIHLSLVGKGGGQEERCLKMVEEDSNITFYGEVLNREHLRDIYRANDFFVMISKRETFGLVYIEALSQGLPIVYTEGQGVDGMTDLLIGEKCKLHDNSICEALANIVAKEYSEINMIEMDRFLWTNKALEYVSIYTDNG